MKFSPSTRFFYDPHINAGGIPEDAVDITRERFEELLGLRGKGDVIEPGMDGQPLARAAESPLPPTLDEVKAQLTARATAMRWQVETGGIVLPNGDRVATAREDQDRITSVLVNAQAAGIESIEFKAASGWLSLSLAQLRDIASAVARHVQASFAAERAHHKAIAALPTLHDAAAYDLADGWPQPNAAASPQN